MNEIEKAIKDLKDYIQLWEDEQADEDLTVIIYKNTIESFKIAKQALEKQIPKKPNGRYCPTCGYGGLEYDKEQSIFVIIDYHHCNSCGQAIDWSEGKEEVCSSQN